MVMPLFLCFLSVKPLLDKRHRELYAPAKNLNELFRIVTHFTLAILSANTAPGNQS